VSTLHEQVVIVTGAGSGIGRATAVAAARAGARVILAGRRAEPLAEAADVINGNGGTAVAFPCDVTARDEIESMVQQTAETWGQVDVLVSNAGVMPVAPMADCRIDDWDHVIDVNLKGLLYGIGAVLPVMLGRGRGHFVNVSSIAGRMLFPGATVYCGTKHAVHAISEGLRAELADLARADGNRIRVTILAPGVVETDLLESITDPDARAGTRGWYDTFKQPLMPEDAADAILYALTAPPHVNVNEVVVRPVEQRL
jgi:NADP-dependent 3-hydroxy acid dehydrogenase YdfG